MMRGVKLRYPLLALLLLVPAPTIGVVAAMLVFKDAAIGKIIWMASKAWIVALPIAWLWWVDGGRVSVSPIPLGRRRGAIVAGMVSGGVIFGLIVAGYAALGRHWIDAEAARAHLTAVGLGHRGLYLGAAIYWITINSVIEEYVWRWFVYTRWAAIVGRGKVWRWAVAGAGAGLAFTLHHVVALGLNFQWNAAVVALASEGVFVGGVTWSALYARYQSIWPGWISHAWADVAVFGVGYVMMFEG